MPSARAEIVALRRSRPRRERENRGRSLTIRGHHLRTIAPSRAPAIGRQRLPTADRRPQLAANSWSKLARNCVIIAPRIERQLRAGRLCRRGTPEGTVRCGLVQGRRRRQAVPSAARADAAAPTRGRGRRMSNFVVAIAVFLITVIGALFAVPYFVDWNGYRSVFEEEATRLLGREVRVGGAVNLHLLPTPYFRFEKVRIADTSVNLQEPFFRTDSLTIKLAIPPMHQGRGGGQRDRAAAAGAAPGARRRRRLELAELRPGARQVRLPARQRCADVGQDRRRRAGRARPRRRRAHALRGLQRRVLRPRPRWPLPAARHLRQGRRRARAAGSTRRGAEATAPCASRPSCGSTTAPRPTRWMAASLDLMGKPRIEGELTRAAADRRPVAGAAARQLRARRRRAPSTRSARTKARPRSTSGPPCAPIRPARRSPISPCRSSRTDGPSSSPAS